MRITRSDIYIRDEKGGDWFEEFLNSYAKKESNAQDVLDAMNQKRGETVESVVEQYRKMTGLDSDASEEHDGLTATASTQPLSMRHAHMMQEPQSEVVILIEKDPEIKADIESICEHSGGTKETHAILNFLRERLGRELVSFSDEDLSKYIEDIKGKYYEEKHEPRGNIGRVGTESEDSPEDDAADYMTHGNRG